MNQPINDANQLSESSPINSQLDRDQCRGPNTRSLLRLRGAFDSIMSVPSYRDPQHWRDRAAEARAVAKLLKNPQARIEMLNIAQSYERMVANAQAQIDEAEKSSEGDIAPSLDIAPLLPKADID
jgi:hypothetical protein